MNEMQLFTYEGKELRTVIEGEEIWWIGKEVCEILELSDVGKSIERLDDDEKLIRKIFVSGQNRDVWTVNEPGLYSLILTSNKPEAKKFKRWITHEVIPSIRKTGGYGNIEPQISSDFAFKIAKEKRLLDKLNLEKAKFFSSLLEKQSPLLPPSSTQRAMSEISEVLFGKKLIELPMLETKHYSLLEILKEFEKETGILLSKQKAGRLLKKYNLQVPGSGNGEFFKDKSQSSEKEVSSWKYSEMGKQRVIEILKSEFMK